MLPFGINELPHFQAEDPMLLKTNDLSYSAFVNIKPIESTTYAFYAVRNVTGFALNH
jgi:hypothetical protein